MTGMPGQPLDRRRESLRLRIERSYRTLCETVSIGPLRLEFTRIADPDDMARHMPPAAEADQDPLWQPYWAANWDASWAVAHILLDQPLDDRHVLDLGCGLGLTGAVAAACNARVWMVDAAQPSLLLARLNTWPWRDRVNVRRLDWRRERLSARALGAEEQRKPELQRGRRQGRQAFDLIVGSDIIYDRDDWPYLERFWADHLAATGRLLLGESGRSTGALFPDWLAERHWIVERSEIHVPQCRRALRIIWARPMPRCGDPALSPSPRDGAPAS